MCRCTDPDGAEQLWRPPPRRAMRIRAFHVRLILGAAPGLAIPEVLTLVLLPGTPPLEVNGTKVRPGVPALVPLYRFRSAEAGADGPVFASADRVMAGEGQRFEAYVGEKVAVRGALRKGEGGWGLEVRGGGEAEVGATVRVVGEKGEVIEGEVALPPARRARKGRFCARLERIPEEGEGEDCGCCGCCEEGWEVVEKTEEEEEAEEMEGVGWAVDVGIWVMCLGVGLLVSKASASYNIGAGRRRRGFLF